MTTNVRVRVIPTAPVVRARVLPANQPLQVEIRNTGTVIQWRRGVNGTWNDLIEVADLDASVAVGTVTTLAPGEPATVTNVGTPQDVILDFGIPAGEDGDDGDDGEGVPSGGTTGQVLAKATGTDYDTTWVDTVTPVANRTALKAIAATAGMVRYLREGGREGIFVFDASDLSADVTVDTQEGIYIAPASDTTGASGAWVRDGTWVTTGVRPEWFGAVADGVTNCRPAIQGALALLSHKFAGGQVQLSAGTYGISSAITWTNTSKITFSGVGDATKIKGLGTYSGPYFNLGSGSPAGGSGTILRDFMSAAPAGGTANWFATCEWMNSMLVERVKVLGTTGGFVMETSYGVTFTDCAFAGMTAQCIYSLTSCHHLTIRGCGFFNAAYTSGSQVIRIDVATYNIIIDENDFEYVGAMVHVTSARALSFCRNYHEQSDVELINFNGTCQDVIVAYNYFSAASVTTTLENVVRLTFEKNVQSDASFAFASSVIDPTIIAGALELGSTIGLQTRPRPTLGANRTYYVRTDGSDSNTGLSNSSGGAFLTIGKACDVVASIDLSIYTVTIQVAAGTYTEALTLKPLVGAGAVIIRGDPTTPANVVLDGTITIGNHFSNWSVNGVKFTGSGVAITATAAAFAFQNVEFASTGAAHVLSLYGAYVQASGHYSISGSAARHLQVLAGNIRVQGRTVTLTGTPAFSTAFANATSAGVIALLGNTYSGSATGSRYAVTTNGVVNTNGAGATALPGDAAGSTASGGQYA